MSGTTVSTQSNAAAIAQRQAELARERARAAAEAARRAQQQAQAAQQKAQAASKQQQKRFQDRFETAQKRADRLGATANRAADRAISAERTANARATDAGKAKPFSAADRVSDVFDASSLDAASRKQLFGTNYRPVDGAANSPRVNAVYDRLTTNRIAPNGGDSLAAALRAKGLSDAEKQALVTRIAKSGNADLLTQVSDQSPRNVAYDNLQAISSTLGDAYRSGRLSQTDLQSLSSRLGEGGTTALAGNLALDPSNVRAGGIVESLGRVAQANGQPDVAAVAFSSSQALIDRNLKTPAAQQQAFDRVKAITDLNKDAAGNSDVAGQVRARFALEVGNLARLSTSKGVGFDGTSGLRDYLQGMGDTLGAEVVERAIKVPGDTQPGGAVDLLGKTSESLVKQDGQSTDDSNDWRVNAAMAYTSSNALIGENLGSPARVKWALDGVNAQLDDQANRLEEVQASSSGYSLQRSPALQDGAARLLASDQGSTFIRSAMSSSSYEDDATLESTLKSTLFDPNTSQAAKNQLVDAVNSNVYDLIRSNDATQTRDAGKLLGSVQRAAKGALDDANQDGIDQAYRDNQKASIARSLGGVLLGATLSAGGVNPVGAGIANGIASPVFNKVFPDENPMALGQQYQEQVRQDLAKDGTDVNLGLEIKDELDRGYDARFPNVRGRPSWVGDTEQLISDGFSRQVERN